MRLDYLTIFPDYLAPLSLSLPGKAVESGLLEVHVHDLRTWTHDRHRSVDDTPYGGGAGMVLKPEPFGEAFDALGIEDSVTLVFTTPSGEPFTQAVAADLSTKQRLVFACGRYEGFDERIIDHARTRCEVRELSIGDYVLNGGEAAAPVITEAVVRLLPGFLGNAESLSEESHTDGLLEYPTYTKPPAWRGLEVPEVLRSGDHGRIALWRDQQRRERTALRRPDLLPASAAVTEWPFEPARPADAGELLTLWRACWVQEALLNQSLDIPVFTETVDDVRADLVRWQTWVVRVGGRIVGSARGLLVDAWDGSGERWWMIGRVCAAPDLQGRGIGRAVLDHLQALAPPESTRLALMTGAASESNHRFYRRAGFRLRPDLDHATAPGTVAMTKANRSR